MLELSEVPIRLELDEEVSGIEARGNMGSPVWFRSRRILPRRGGFHWIGKTCPHTLEGMRLCPGKVRMKNLSPTKGGRGGLGEGVVLVTSSRTVATWLEFQIDPGVEESRLGLAIG